MKWTFSLTVKIVKSHHFTFINFELNFRWEMYKLTFKNFGINEWKDILLRYYTFYVA